MEQNNVSMQQIIVEKPETYIAPVIEIIEIKVEKGFAVSEPPSGPGEGFGIY